MIIALTGLIDETSGNMHLVFLLHRYIYIYVIWESPRFAMTFNYLLSVHRIDSNGKKFNQNLYFKHYFIFVFIREIGYLTDPKKVEITTIP